MLLFRAWYQQGFAEIDQFVKTNVMFVYNEGYDLEIWVQKIFVNGFCCIKNLFTLLISFVVSEEASKYFLWWEVHIDQGNNYTCYYQVIFNNSGWQQLHLEDRFRRATGTDVNLKKEKLLRSWQRRILALSTVKTVVTSSGHLIRNFTNKGCR